MCIEQREFSEQFRYQAPILPDSLDNATAFFYAVNQVIRSTRFETSVTMASNNQGFAGPLLNRLNVHIRDIVLSAVGRMRCVGFTAASTWRRRT
jgi:hypothetical protein